MFEVSEEASEKIRQFLEGREGLQSIRILMTDPFHRIGEEKRLPRGELCVRCRDGQMITIGPVTSEHDSEELDHLLWETLWKPIGFPRNIRESFALEGKTFILAARNEGIIVGGLVAVWTSVHEVEIRHIAVISGSQKNGIGSELVKSLLKTVAIEGCSRVHTIARHTSTGFFFKMGFTKAAGTPPEHPDFKEHGILFELMERATEQNIASDTNEIRWTQ